MKKPRNEVEPGSTGPDGAPVVEFPDADAWEAWLANNHGRSPGVWLRLAKKAAGAPPLSYGEALDVALCHGWIDGQKRGESKSAWLQKFGPRTEKSIWSRINREKAIALGDAGRMKPAGRNAIERAQMNGRWEAAYDSPRTATIPDDLQAALDRNPRARAFFATLNSQNRYAVLYRIQTARKSETRGKRIEKFVGMLARGEKLHP